MSPKQFALAFATASWDSDLPGAAQGIGGTDYMK